MGDVRNAHCDCGFQSAVRVGGGRATFREKSSFPFYCKNCGLVDVNVARPERSCPTCNSVEIVQYGKPPVSLTHPEIGGVQWGEYCAPLMGNLCPKCSKFTMVFTAPNLLFD